MWSLVDRRATRQSRAPSLLPPPYLPKPVQKPSKSHLNPAWTFSLSNYQWPVNPCRQQPMRNCYFIPSHSGKFLQIVVVPNLLCFLMGPFNLYKSLASLWFVVERLSRQPHPHDDGQVQAVQGSMEILSSQIRNKYFGELQAPPQRARTSMIPRILMIP